MSRIFGPIRQNGYVVHDIEKAMQHWATVVGVGPWFYVERAPIQLFEYQGQPSDVDVSIAISNSGPLQIELIQPRSEAPSMYRDFLDRGHEGLQHIAYWTTDFDADLQRGLDSGLSVGQRGQIGSRGRFLYFADEGTPGTVVELSEVSGGKGRMFTTIAQICSTWDGTDPVRDFPRG